MARITIDLDNVSDSNLIDEGWRVFRVINCETKQSKEGNDYLNWELHVNEPGEPNHEKKTWYITSLKDTGLPMLKRFIRACEFEWTPDGFSTEDLYGLELECKIVHEDYQGEKQNRIKSVRPVS